MALRQRALVEAGYPYLVAEIDSAVFGYAYAGPYRHRPAYRWSVESSIYVAPEAHRRGVGRALLDALIADAERRGFRQMIAVIGDSSQLSSIELHRAAGFRFVGNIENVGYKFERPIERHLGGPRATAYGLLAGAAAMLAGDTRPQLRGRGEARAIDGLVLGVAQAAALAPGVSRNGITLAAARWRHFSRDQANLLSRTIALPIIVGATALKGTRLARRGASPELRRSLAIGVVASFASTLASQRLIKLVERDRALWPYAAYRAALAAAVLARLHLCARRSTR